MIDFASVKQVSIPQGEVKSISVNGSTVWKKPDGGNHTEIEYVTFNADKTFDTGIICTQNTKIEIKFTRETSAAQYMYGTRNSNNTASVTAYLSNSGTWRFGKGYKNFTLDVSATEPHTAVVDKTGIIMDGKNYSYVVTVNNFEAISTLTIGSTRGTGGAYGGNQYVGKIYYFRMYEGSNLILDLQPVRNSQGVECFLDKVSNKFFTNVE